MDKKIDWDAVGMMVGKRRDADGDIVPVFPPEFWGAFRGLPEQEKALEVTTADGVTTVHSRWEITEEHVRFGQMTISHMGTEWVDGVLSLEMGTGKMVFCLK